MLLALQIEDNLDPLYNDSEIELHSQRPIKGSSITDKEFYKAMQKLKDRGTHAVPPKKSASAYIIFGKEVILFKSNF